MIFKDDTFFKKNKIYGVKGEINYVFSKQNLLIGKNGAGKSRFLESAKSYYIENETNIKIINADFTKIISKYDKDNNKSDESLSLYDVLLEDQSIDVSNFIKLVEDDNFQFLTNILSDMKAHSKYVKKRNNNTIDELNKFVGELIDRRILFDKDDVIVSKKSDTLGERNLLLKDALLEMSPGELSLLYISIFLIYLKSHIDSTYKLIIFLDEPELHLHPKTLLKFIQMLKDELRDGELWLASHSLFLIPLFEFNEIVLINDSTLCSRSSELYTKLYDTLVGLENKSLYDFMHSINNWQYYNFISECFCFPESIGIPDPYDKQFILFKEYILSKKDEGSIKILDYGAGKGRIGSCIDIQAANSCSDFENIEYEMFDEYTEYNLNCKYKYWSDINSLLNSNNKYHCVILMNVLHEIDVTKWIETFDNIEKLLYDDGVVLFIEVKTLTYGEHPYGNHGFILLGENQIRLLTSDDKNSILKFIINEKDNSNCFIIPKTLLKNINSKTMINALNDLKDETFNELNRLAIKKSKIAKLKPLFDIYQKNINNNEISIRKYAYLSQLYINTLISIEAYSKHINSNIVKYVDNPIDKLSNETSNLIKNRINNTTENNKKNK